MPRIRSIKPDLCADTKVARVSEAAELMWVKLWTHSDDDGRFLADADDVLATVYAARRSITAEQVEERLGELAREGLIRLYEAEGRRLGVVPKFRKHQKISHPVASQLPAPPESSGALRNPPEPSGGLASPQVSRAHAGRDPIHSNPDPDPSPSPEGGPGETEPAATEPDPLAGWGRHLAAVPVGALPEAWRCAEAAFAAWYRQRRRLPWKASAASGRALRGLAVAIADTAAATGLTEEAVIDRALANFGADPFAVTSDFPPALLETKWGAYFDPPEIPRPKGAMHPCPPPGAHGNDLADQLGLEVANG